MPNRLSIESVIGMSHFLHLLRHRVASDAFMTNVGQYACYAAAPTVLVAAIRAVTRMASTPAELLIGIIASSTLALVLVIMGLVAPLANHNALPRPTSPRDQVDS